ncbi:TIGR03086 family protein [Rhodococcus rhodnii]|uniref:Mycothiol-dependent maleylpyruvate isomerase metal-binding domain-containing protein n=2 Tax=Rhodococcus rhodnii TaxID=38312 RepID=R7WMW0_9NOCA|nr:TIGR03086 family metal-binding protein [Rhodococcus rhodnii]EOM75309.1 hypothetical protein Rrhod_3366 [Rhodococcus rhodnii LMG 5362]TXG92485.1 TIGR03086 family protein [Rhodococcus rhodnii]
MGYDWISLQTLARDEFTRRLDAVTDWNAPTPDTDWTVLDLAVHVTTEQQWVPPLLAGRTVARARREIAPLHGDLSREWERYASAATDAWATTPPENPVHLSFGTVTAEFYLRQQTSDITVHAWDLARAIGGDTTLDPVLAAAVWEDLRDQADALAASGLFAPPVPVPDDAPVQDRLLALTGRDPSQ